MLRLSSNRPLNPTMRRVQRGALWTAMACAALTVLGGEDTIGFQPPIRAAGGFAPDPVVTSIEPGQEVTLQWFGFQGPYQVQQTDGLGGASWTTVSKGYGTQATVSAAEGDAFYRVIGADPNYAGAAVCLECHDTHQDWAATAHAHAIESLQSIGQQANAGCLPCHTVGYGSKTGFQDLQTTPHLAGVQCENCHGPAANHAGSPTDPTFIPLATASAIVCGGCHTDAHHPTYDEWDLSRHGHALEGLRSSDHALDTCLNCHSEDYRYAVANNRPTVPTVQTATLSLECSTCHAPHGGVTQDHLIRKPIDALCGECHTQGEATLGGSPHHPQYEMLQGIGAYQADGSPLAEPSYHSAIAKSCAQCHVVRHAVDSPNEGNPNVTGHTFNPFDESINQHPEYQYDGCAACHEITVAFQKRKEVFQDFVRSQVEALAPFFTVGDPSYIDPDTLNSDDQDRWEVARFNYLFVDADKSDGIHNFENARRALVIAADIVQDLSQPATE